MGDLNKDFDLFDPTNLAIFNEPQQSAKSSGNPLVYKTRPEESVSEDGVYRCTIKPVYNPFNLTHSIIEQQSYSMQDSDGWFSVVSSLTVNDKSCPIFTAWKKCRYAQEGTMLHNQLTRQNGDPMFDKRFARYITIQVIEDKNHPELEGQYLFWKLPRSIYDLIQGKMNPAAESNKAPIPVLDFLFGRSIDIEVKPGPDDKLHPERKRRETSYQGEISDDVVSCTKPDKSSLLTDKEQEVLDKYIDGMKPYWKSKDAKKRQELLAAVNADPNTKELKKIYKRVLDEVKTFIPNVEEHMGYKPWSEEVKQRVQRWINTVLSGNDPASIADTPATLNLTDTPDPLVPYAAGKPSEDEDLGDLPF